MVQLFFTVALLFLASCTKSQKDSLSGGAFGSKPEAIIVVGGEPLIEGSSIGVASKASVKANLSPEDRQVLAERAPLTLQKLDCRAPLDINDIKKMSQNGISEEVIMKQIADTKSSFHLTDAQILELKEAGVSEKVVNYMITTGV